MRLDTKAGYGPRCWAEGSRDLSSGSGDGSTTRTDGEPVRTAAGFAYSGLPLCGALYGTIAAGGGGRIIPSVGLGWPGGKYCAWLLRGGLMLERGGGRTGAAAAELGTRSWILGYVTGDTPPPGYGDSATGDRLLGGSSGGEGSFMSSEEVLKTVTSLSVDAALVLYGAAFGAGWGFRAGRFGAETKRGGRRLECD